VAAARMIASGPRERGQGRCAEDVFAKSVRFIVSAKSIGPKRGGSHLIGGGKAQA
jgi:hypothetical protein